MLRINFGNVVSLIALLFVTACSEMNPKANNINTYRIPWGQQGQVIFQDVVIDDLKDPYYMTGSSAHIILTGDYSHVQGPQGETAKPNMIRSGNVLVPIDLNSLAAVSAYAHMNRLHKLDESLGFKSLLKWPRTVGVNTIIKVGEGFHAANNAFYSFKNDSINLLPYTEDRNPFYINGAILAHEHFHALYHNNVEWQKINRLSAQGIMDENNKHVSLCEDEEFYKEVYGLLRSDQVNLRELDTQSEAKVAANSLRKLVHQTNYVISRAWDEASADNYGYYYDKNADFLSFSLKGGEYRKLTSRYSGFFRKADTLVSYLRLINEARCEESSVKIKILQRLGFDTEEKLFYLMAADFAKFLKKLSQSKTVSDKYGTDSQRKILQAIVNSFGDINKYLKENYNNTFLNPAQPIEFVLNHLSISKDQEVCSLISQLFGQTYCQEEHNQKVYDHEEARAPKKFNEEGV